MSTAAGTRPYFGATGLVDFLKVCLLPLCVALSILLGTAFGAVGTPLTEVIGIIVRQVGIPLGPVWPVSASRYHLEPSITGSNRRRFGWRRALFVGSHLSSGVAQSLG